MESASASGFLPHRFNARFHFTGYNERDTRFHFAKQRVLGRVAIWRGYRIASRLMGCVDDHAVREECVGLEPKW